MFRRLRHWLEQAPILDSIERQQSVMVQTLLLVIPLLMSGGIAAGVLLLGPSILTLKNIGPSLVLMLVTLLALLLLRKGYFRAAVLLITSAIVLRVSAGLLTNGLLASTNFFISLTVPVIMVGLLLGRRWLIAACSVTTIAIGGGVLRDLSLAAQPPQPSPIPTMLSSVLTIWLIALIVDRFASVLRRALSRAADTADELTLINATLYRERERFETTLASIGDAVIATDLHGRITFLNPVAEQLTGWRRADALGQPMSDVFTIVNELTGAPAESPADVVLREGRAVGLANHTELISRDSTRRPIDDSGAPIRSPGGPVQGVVVVFRDVTERRNAERAVRASEALFRTLANSTTALIWMADATGRRTFFNLPWLAFTGQQLDQALGHGWELSMHPEDVARYEVAYRNALQNQEPFNIEFRLRRADGVYRWIAEQSVPITMPTDSGDVLLGSCLDITEHRLLEERLEGLIFASSTVLQTLDHQHVLPAVVALSRQLIAADAYAIWRRDEEEAGTWHVIHAIGVSEEFQRETVRDMGSTPAVVTEPWIVPDLTSNPALTSRLPTYEREGIRSVMVLPLRLHGSFAGTLVFYYREPQTFDRQEIRVASALADLAATTITTAEIYQRQTALRLQAEQARGEQSLLAETGQLLAAALASDTTLQQLGHLLTSTIAHWCAIYVLEDDASLSQILVMHRDPVLTERARELQQRYPASPARLAALRSVLETSQPVLVSEGVADQIARSAESADHLEMMRALGLVSYVLLPLVTRGRTIGILALGVVDEGRGYVAEQLPFLRTLSQRIALALDNVQLFRNAEQALALAERANQWLMRLQSITAALAAAVTQEQVLEIIVQHGRAALQAQKGVVAQLNTEHNGIELIAAEGMETDVREHYTQIPLDAPLPLTDAIRTGSQLYLETSADYERLYPHLLAALPANQRSQAMAVLPMQIEGRTIGAIGFGFDTDHHLSTDERAFLEALALHCAQALERARLYNEAQHAILLREQFFGLAAHELRTPMTTMLGSAQLLQRAFQQGQQIGERQRHRMDVLIGQMLRLNRLIGSLLDISRIQEGRLTVELEPLDLCATIARIVDELQPTLASHTLDLTLPAGPCMVAGDQLRLEQVVQNLLQNAVKYSPDGGRIALTILCEAGGIRVHVTDQGMGIPAEEQGRIFERFYRASNVDPHHLSGMGIGLAVVAEVVRLHGGTIEVRSQVGEGSTFTMWLPSLDGPVES